MTKQKTAWTCATVLTAAAAVASAQPAPDDNPGSGSGDNAERPPPVTPGPPARPEVPANPYGAEPVPEAAKPPKPPRKPDPPLKLPQVISIPTGWLLPAAVVYSRTGLDTGGGFASDNRVGLGDVAEFGVSTLDEVRVVRTGMDPTVASDHLQPYVAATFRMGLAEDRLFPGQPGLVLGFRKSFERSYEGFKTRIAELTLVASQQVGQRAALHLGGAFWDASLEGNDSSGAPFTSTLHGYNDLTKQVRAFGGFEAHPLEKSEILIDFGWAPTFCYQCTGTDQIRLRPQLAWGVRYDVADWMKLESGVRVADIGHANLLDAQIFGQVTFVTWSLRHAVDDLKK